MSAKKPTKQKQKPDVSHYLDENENKKIIQLLENENQVSSSTAIAQVFISKPHEHKDWIKVSSGILCLVKDYNKKSYYFRLYNLTPALVWEEGLYVGFVYKKITDLFYYFPGYNNNVGLNFAFANEADKFQQSISKALELMNKRNDLSSLNKPITFSVTTPIEETLVKKSIGFKRAEKKRINKNLIGNPIGFVHLNHIGVSDSNGYNIKMSENDTYLSMIVDVLKKLNIEPNKASVEYANNFIQANGGYQKLKEEINNQQNNSNRVCIEIQSTGSDSKCSPDGMIQSQNSNSQHSPNGLKMPSRPPPRPPAFKANSIKLESTPNIESSLSFVSPIPPAHQSDNSITGHMLSVSAESSISTPKQQKPQSDSNQYLEDSNNNYKSINENSIMNTSTEPNRNDLLKSIVNFKGGLKPVSIQHKKIEHEIPDNNNNNIMNQLFKALGDMRPYLTNSDDESGDSFEDDY